MDMLLKNKFAAMDMEETIQIAFDNLQNSKKQISKGHGCEKPTTSVQNLELALIDNATKYLFDVAGTKDKSNHGVHFCQSAPTLEGEQDILAEAGVCTRKSKKNHEATKQSTRTCKEKHGAHFNHI